MLCGEVENKKSFALAKEVLHRREKACALLSH